MGHLFFLMPPSKLKNQVNQLTRLLMILMTMEVTAFFISQCICQLVNALALSGCGGINLESQLENIIGVLFQQLSAKVNPSDPHSVENCSLALPAFYILAKLYQDQMVSLILSAMESTEPAKIESALQAFTDVFQELPLTEKLLLVVLNSTMLVIQEDLEPCICQLANALALSGCGGINLESQLENIIGVLFQQLSAKVNPSDPHSVENCSLALRAFYILAKLYQDQMVSLILSAMESTEPAKIESALQAFTDVFQELPLTEKLLLLVLNSTMLVIQEDLEPCICQLVNALALSGCGGINLESQLENIIGVLFQQLSAKVNPSDPHSVENCSLALRAFYILAKLYQDQMVSLILSAMESTEPAKIESALQAFTDVFQELPLTEKLLRVVLNSTMLVIQEDLEPVLEVLMHFIEILGQHNYLALPQGNTIISYIIKIMESDPSNEEDIQIMCSRILQMVSLPKLVTLVCEPNNTLAFVPLCKAATQMALKARSLGQVPYLSSFHFNSTQFISPQRLLTHLVAFLYKFFGFALWTSRSEKLVKMMLSSILQTSHENLQEREGIAVAFSIVSRKHLKTVLEQLKVYSAILTDKDSSSILKLEKEHQRREWVLVCNTIYLTYGKIILGSKGAIFVHLDAILALILQHYHNCILEKDKDLKLDYLNALIILTKILGSQQHVAFQFKFPHKLAIVTFMVDLIKEEPLNSISSPVRQKAMNIINNFRMLRPLLEIEERVELLSTCFKSVFCLPSIEVLQKEASSPKEGQANVDLFKETMQSLLRLMETLIVEMPTRIQNCLQAVCALCEMLSRSLCLEAIQELYPRLLLAVLCHLYWVIEQNASQKMVVYRKDGGAGKTFDPTSCALEVVKLVFTAAYDGVVVYADEHKCWDLLSCPKFYYIGIMELTSGIVKNCEPVMLHRILNLAKNLLNSVDNRQKILARTVYAQLLWHRSVAQSPGQDFVRNLVKWTKEPNLIMKEIGLRGISNLALHPRQSQSLKSLVPFLCDFVKSEARVTVQAVKALRNIIYHGQGEEVKVVFCSISKHLRPLINDERDQVRITAISALGHMLHRVNQFKPGYAIQKHLYSFLVPLLLSFQDNNTEVVKACGAALTEWTNVIGWSSFTQMFQHTTLSDHIQVLEETCKYLVSTCKRQLVGELLFQSFSFLKSSQSFLRTTAVHFIGLIAEKINLHYIHEDDVQLLRNALESMKNDPVESNQILVNTLLQNIEEYVNPVDSSTSIISTRFFRLSGRRARKRKRHLFKTVIWEGDNDTNRQRNWLLGPLNLLCTWCKGG